MAIGGGFVLDSEWYWRIFEGEATLGDEPGAVAARELLIPLARLAKDRVAIEQIAVDGDGDGVSFRVADQPVSIRCRGLRIDRFVDAVNRSFADAKVDLAFAIVESRRYELRGVLIAKHEVPAGRPAVGAPTPSPPSEPT